MFKKTLKVSSSEALTGKDKKKLISDLSKFFDVDSIKALVEKNETIVTKNKLSGSKMVIYTIGDAPIFADATGKGDLFPSIYAVQQCPDLIKSVEINEGVDNLIIGGANLMWAGVKDVKALGPFNKDDVRYVKTIDNRIVAIGALACGAAEVGTGVAMFMLHILNDKLYELGPKKTFSPIFTHAVAKKEEAPQKSAGKEEVKVDETKTAKKQEKEKEKKKEESSEEEEEEEEESEEEQGGDDFVQFFGGMIKKKPAPGAGPAPTKKTTTPAAKPTASKPVAAPKKQVDFDDDEDDNRKKKGGKKDTKAKGKKKDEEEEPSKKQKGKKGKKAKESESEDEDEEDEDEEEKVDTKAAPSKGGSIPTKIMDEYLMEAFLTALKVSLDESDLPIDGQEFFSKHMNPCRREGINLDLKNTTYQKMGKFLQAMTKQGIIDFKESKKGANPQIIKVNRHHPRVADFEPVVSKSSKKDNKDEEEDEEEERYPKVDIQELCKIKSQIATFFPEDADQEKLYTQEEVQNVIHKYVNTNNLNEKKFIKLDEKMRPLFWVEKAESESEGEEEGEGEEGKKKKKQKQPQYTLSKEELNKKIEDYLVPYHKIIDLQTKEEEVKQGAVKPLTIITEKVHNKIVTKISGLETFRFNIPKLASTLQSKLSAAVSTHHVKEKNAERTELTAQGNVLDQVEDYLRDECKVDEKYLSSTDKVSMKKKEKTYGI